MKRKEVLLPMLFIVCICCIWVTVASSDQRDYTMVCKGGGGMRADLLPDDKWINIHFSKSPQAGTQHEPAPGTCAWVDRPLRADEPTQLSFKFDKRPWKYEIRKQTITLPLNAIEDSNLRYLVDGVYNGKLFYVRCHQESGHKYFRITRIGP